MRCEAMVNRSTSVIGLARAACATLVLSTCWLLLLGTGSWAVLLFATSVALIPLLQAVRHRTRQEPGLAAFWSGVAVPMVGLLFWPASHAANIGHLLPGFVCDAMADDCGIAPWYDWVSVGLYLLTELCALVVMVRSFVERWGYDNSDKVHLEVSKGE